MDGLFAAEVTGAAGAFAVARNTPSTINKRLMPQRFNSITQFFKKSFEFIAYLQGPGRLKFL